MRFLLFALTVLTAGLLVAASPSTACGCGGFAGDPVAVSEERALVVFDGSRETIVMRFDLASPAQPGGDSAWIMPVPAKPALELADGEVFGRIDRATGPERLTDKRYHLGFEPADDDETTTSRDGAPAIGAAGGAAGDSVEVLDRRRLGSYEISTLAADDRGALLDWLEENGYELPPDLAEGVDFYIDKGWLFTAAKVVTGEAADGPSGLSPISVSFATREPVYPLYLSRAAEQPMELRLDIVASGRVDLDGLGTVTRMPDREVKADERESSDGPDPAETTPAQGVVMRYSGEVPGAARSLARGQPHMTSYRAMVEPSEITDDPRLTVSSDREEFRPKLITVEDVYLGEYVVGAVVVLLLAAGAALIVVQRRRNAHAAG